ncbi:MAG: peptide deformylase [Bacteroidota bacterium]|nr:peptide deformylase [Bacteroidota bacterium]
MIYPIVAYGNPVLKQRAKDILKGSIDVVELSNDMFETMYNAHGVGLAAPQIGMGVRMFVVDSDPMSEDGENDLKGFKRVFINPQIIDERGEEWAFEEGCLSIPGIREEIFRNEELEIHYFDENWQEHKEVYSGIKARIIQHEYDHIEGVLFTDYLTGFKKRLLKNKLINISKGNVSSEYRMVFK